MRVVIAPGASGTSATMKAHVDGLRARGIDASAIDIPKGKAEKAVTPYLAASGEGPDVVIGGQSYGGRVASLLAAEEGRVFGGLVLFSYPLHAPGRTDWQERAKHWASIRCPVLFLSGESDPLARIGLLRSAVAEGLPTAELVTYPGQGHWLAPVLDDVLDRVAAFVTRVEGTRAGRGD